jgi:hypothetical protein
MNQTVAGIDAAELGGARRASGSNAGRCDPTRDAGSVDGCARGAGSCAAEASQGEGPEPASIRKRAKMKALEEDKYISELIETLLERWVDV